jgi:hypothetical protein
MGLGLGILRRTSGVREAKQSNASEKILFTTEARSPRVFHFL